MPSCVGAGTVCGTFFLGAAGGIVGMRCGLPGTVVVPAGGWLALAFRAGTALALGPAAAGLATGTETSLVGALATVVLGTVVLATVVLATGVIVIGALAADA